MAVTKASPSLKHILVLHCEDALRRAVPALVADTSACVTVCDRIESVADLLAKRHYDLIVAAFGEGREALATAKAIRAQDPLTPLILAGDAIQTNDLIEVFALRVCDVYERPFDTTTFVARIRRELQLSVAAEPDEALWKRVNEYLGWPSFDRDAKRIHGAYLDLKAQNEALQEQSGSHQEAANRIHSEEAMIMVERQEIDKERSKLDVKRAEIEALAAASQAKEEAIAAMRQELETAKALLAAEQLELETSKDSLHANFELEVKALEAEKEMFDAQLADFVQRREVVEEEIAERMAALSERGSELEHMATILDERENHCLGFEGVIAGLDDREAELAERAEAQTAESERIATLEQELKTISDSLSSKEVELHAWESELKSKDTKIQEAATQQEANWAERNTTLAQRESQLNQRLSEYQIAEEKLKVDQATLAASQADFEKTQIERKEIIGKLDETITSKRNRIAELEISFEQRKVEIDKLESKIQADLQALEREQSAQAEATLKLEKDRSALNSSVHIFEQSKKALDVELEELDIVRNALKTREDSLRDKEEALKTKQTSLEHWVEEQRKTLEADKQVLAAERGQFTHEIEGLETLKTSLAKQQNAVRQEQLALIDEQTELAERKHAMDERQAQNQAERAALEAMRSRLDQEIEERLEVEQLRLRQTERAADRERERLATELKELRDLRQELLNEHRKFSQARVALLAERKRLLSTGGETISAIAEEGLQEDAALMASAEQAIADR